MLQDGKIHTIDEIYNECVEKGMINVEDKGSVRSAIFTLKAENKRFVAVEKGKYKLNDIDEEENTMGDEFEKALESIKKRINELKKFNWVTCSDEELNTARKQINSMMKLHDDIKKLVYIQFKE